jgi:hypothetical protein
MVPGDAATPASGEPEPRDREPSAPEPGELDPAELDRADRIPTELDPAGVLTRSVDEGSGFIPVQSALSGQLRPAQQAQLSGTGTLRWWPGAAALAGAIGVVVLDAVAVSLAGSGTYVAATAVAWVAIILSAVTVIGGVLAIVLGRGRIAGIVALGLGLVANPFLLARLFEVLHG